VHDNKDFLVNTSQLLVDEADVLHMAFKIHFVVARLETLDFDDDHLHSVLQLKSGEARAIACTQQLHRLLAVGDDDDSSTSRSSSFGSSSAHRFNHQMLATDAARLQQMASSSSSGVACEADDQHPYRSPGTPLRLVSPPATSTPSPLLHQMPPALASFLSAVRSLVAPKVMVVTEQEASHNDASFQRRFAHALHYYASMYDSLHAAAAAAHRRPAAELLTEVERAVLGEEIRDVLLREGARRRERHDRLQAWAARLEMAGFRNVPLSYMAMRRGDDVLRRGGVRGCESRQHGGGCLLMCWCSWPLYSRSRHGAPTEATICHRPPK
jgi:hypothetical protein